MRELKKETFSFNTADSGVLRVSPYYTNTQINLKGDLNSTGLSVDVYYGANTEAETYALEASKKSFKILSANVSAIEITGTEAATPKEIEVVQW